MTGYVPFARASYRPSTDEITIQTGDGSVVFPTLSRDQALRVAGDILELLRAEALAPPAPGWQPMETYDPEKHSRQVIVAIELDAATNAGRFGVGEAHWCGDEGWYWAGNDPSDSWGYRIYPTHFRSFPAPPRAEAREARQVEKENTDDVSR